MRLHILTISNSGSKFNSSVNKRRLIYFPHKIFKVLKCIWHEIFITLLERAFKMMKNGVYFIVIAFLVAELCKLFVLCELDDLWRHIVDTKWCQITKKWNISEDFICIELKLCTVVAFTTTFHDISTVIFPWQHNGLQALSIQKIKSDFSPSRSVICSCCLFSGYDLIWSLHSTSTRSNK